MNIVTLSGRLGKDPDLKKTSNGLSVCSFSLAVARPYAKEGETDTDWIDCVAWKQQADYLSDHAEKGDLVIASGRLQKRSYDRDGSTVYVSEVVCDRVEVMPKRREQQGYTRYTKTHERPTATKEQAAEYWNSYNPDDEVNPDDLPF